MKLLTCSRCNSQFDVASMTPGTSFVCGKCRNVLEVPSAGPVVMPIGNAPRKGGMAPPPTVSMTPEQVQKALRASQEVGKTRRPKPKAAPPKQPPLEQRMQQPATMALSPDQVRKALEASQAVRMGKKPAAAGQRPAAGKPKPQLPKAMQKRAAQQQTVRSGAAAAAAAQPPAGGKAGRKQARKPARKPARGGGRSAPAGTKKSPVPLIAGVGVGVLVLGAAGFFLLSNKGDDATETGTGTGPEVAGEVPGVSGTDTAVGTSGESGTGTGTGPAVALDAVGKLLALPPADQGDDLLGRLRSARGDMAALESLNRFLGDERLVGNAAADTAREKVAKEALKIEDGAAWAREALGHADGLELLKKCQQECTRAFQFADVDEAALETRLKELEDGSKWVTKGEYAKLDALVAKIRTRNDELNSDKRLVQVEKARDWIRKNDLFKGLNVATRYADPYVVFQEYPTFTGSMEHYNDQRVAKANEFARREAHIFNALHARYRELFAERYGFPTLREKNRLMRVLILWNRETFDEWHRRQNSGIQGFVRAYYSPTERQIVHYLGEDTLKEQNYLKAEGNRIQPGADQVTFHEGTHQLQHEYGSILRGTPLTDESGPVPPRKSMWFDEGMAEFFGAVEVDEDKQRDMENAIFYHGRVLLERTNQGRRHRKGGNTVWWSISDMIKPNHNGELVAKGGELLPTNPTWMANIFYGQAWAFVHFSWFYDNGKYRENLLKYQEKVFKLEHGPDALAECYGRPSPDDWGEIEEEYMWYWRQLLKKPAGRKMVDGVPTGAWYIPNTDPPEGTAADEDDGGDYDD